MDISALYQLFQRYPVVTTDSRHCPENSLFFALKGETFDGNDYLEQALAQGVAYAIGDRDGLPGNERIIRVDNVLQTLQDLANYHRKQMGTTLIAITGTNGKTTTKELIAAALSTQYNILYTEGNLNNHIGVPLTLLQLTPEHAFAVIEMGANHPGEIRTLCRIAEPDYGLITNVGKAHLEGFGSFEGVVRTKTELYDFLRENGGTVFVHSENVLLKDRLQSLPAVCYGAAPEDFVHGKMIQASPFLSLEWHSHSLSCFLQTQLAGDYNLENVLAAICVAVRFEVEPARINRAIENYIPKNNRSQNQTTAKNQLIIDAYNANPSSMMAALENFVSLALSPKMVILGEMQELGRYSEEEHRKIVDYLVQNPFPQTVLVGNEFAGLGSLPAHWKIFSQTGDLLEYLKKSDTQGYTILIKGSRGNQLEKTVGYL
jgi:UDP-N-acetylmuramoyl-tripeptide--D-alanyl-D-alanine ligase